MLFAEGIGIASAAARKNDHCLDGLILTVQEQQGKDKRDEKHNGGNEEAREQCGDLAFLSHWSRMTTLPGKKWTVQKNATCERCHWVTYAHSSRVGARRRLSLPARSPALLLAARHLPLICGGAFFNFSNGRKSVRI